MRLVTHTRAPCASAVRRSHTRLIRAAAAPARKRAISSETRDQTTAPIPIASGLTLRASAEKPTANPNVLSTSMVPRATRTPAQTAPQDTLMPSKGGNGKCLLKNRLWRAGGGRRWPH